MKISNEEAFKAMELFLEIYYKYTNSDDIGTLLSGMQLLEDGITADPAMWEEWLECIKKVVKNK